MYNKNIMEFVVNDYKIVKVLKRGGKSKMVTLMQNAEGNKIIKKEYNSKIPTHRDSFRKEVRFLTKLKSYKYVPKLLQVDHANYTFYETYCGGRVPNNDPIYMQKMIDRTKELYEKYGFAYVVDGKQEWFVHRMNYCLMDGEIYIIDFGSIKWKEPGQYNIKEKHVVNKNLVVIRNGIKS